jgi:MscS family membrane protein
MLAISIRWIVSLLELPFLERRFWTVIEVTLAVAAVAWLLFRLTAAAEHYLRRRLPASTVGEMTAMLRLARRAADVLVVAAAGLVMLRVFGLDPTAALAGLGIGGIAVALAAQKTLENVVGGLSIVFDKAVRVGDTLKVGETVGTVDYVGLRSTRIRTIDRTMVSVPNGQIANVNIETLSARDKFRFMHVVALRQETTAAQMRAVVDGIGEVLVSYPAVDQELVRARFFRLGPFSLDIEVFAYINAGGWDAFLEIQQDLLLRILEVVERCGTAIALPSQTLRVTPAPA